MALYIYSLELIVIKKKNKNLLIYNHLKYLILEAAELDYLKEAKIIQLRNKAQYYPGAISLTLLNFFFSWSSIFIKKIRFKGKGYKIVKRNNALKLGFNHAHIIYFFIFNLLNKRLAKQKYLFASKDKNKLTILIKGLALVRKINVFTRRGIRVSSQKILKKIGKRSG